MNMIRIFALTYRKRILIESDRIPSVKYIAERSSKRGYMAAFIRKICANVYIFKIY